MIDHDILNRVPFLADAGPAARAQLAAGGVIRKFPKDAVLWTRGSAPRGLFIVIEGRVRVVRGARGRQHVLHVEGPGGTLGDVPLFSGGSFPATAIAIEPTACLVLTRETLNAAMTADPAFAWLLLGRLAERVRILIERLDRVALQDVVARLAAYLLTRVQETGRHEFALDQTQSEIAEELGTVREVVVRAFRKLRDAQWIRTSGRGRIEVLNPAALATLIGDEP